jgi:hypothetical protein
MSVELTLTDNLTDINKSNLKRKIIYLCSNKLSLDHTIFNELDCNLSILERPHKMILITVLVNRYLNVRLKSFGKQYTASINIISKRYKLNKLILFSYH